MICGGFYTEAIIPTFFPTILPFCYRSLLYILYISNGFNSQVTRSLWQTPAITEQQKSPLTGSMIPYGWC